MYIYIYAIIFVHISPFYPLNTIQQAPALHVTTSVPFGHLRSAVENLCEHC